jgi:hypothetical protein
MPHMSHYNPSQPRVPRGYRNGGQWTDGDFTLLHQAFAAPGLVAPFVGSEVAKDLATALLAAPLLRFAWLSIFNGPKGRAIIKFRAREYRSVEEKDENAFTLDPVKWLSEDEVGKMCERLADVQRETDEAVTFVRKNRKDASTRAAFGSAVHARIKYKIHGPYDEPKYENFRAEKSYWKWKEETIALDPDERKRLEQEEIGYGAKGSIRVDVLEKTRNGTVCVYDVKTGLNSPLTGPRMDEIARAVARVYGPRPIVVTQVTPSKDLSKLPLRAR